MNKFKKPFDQSNIWQQIKSRTLQEQVEKYSLSAASLLDTVILTFNTYTLHNREHITNVINNMDELLGERVNGLTEYEAAFLLLSAFYHDIGMSYRKEDLINITQEPHFQGFLDKNISAKLEFEKTKPNLTEDFKLWYCRAVHHLRSKDFVNKNFAEIELNNYHIFAQELGQLCESHNWEIAEIRNLPNNALADEVDLKFCALILRLADILDFDNSRSPDAIYKYLGLENAKDKAQKISDLEWRKHAAARGFDFKKRSKNSRYDLHFTANPKHPAVEHDLRDFLDVIENELNGCQILVSSCSQRWQNFMFPNKILRDNIKSVGYKYGNYKFQLQQDQVLNLLMGENLYGDKKVFLRELLQNAIDTSRFREVSERDNGKPDFKAEPIVISDWKDEDGYQWVRIDDYGVGMDEKIILNYFLKIGQSFYTSSEFELEKLRFQNAQNQKFTPISRFGIGILSCFMVADKIEVSTRKKGQNALRLSLEDMQGFFILKEETQHHKPDSMPFFPKNEEGYRKEVGTSVVIRLNPAKIFDLDVYAGLSNFVATCSIPIYYGNKNNEERKLVGEDFETAIMKPWLDEPFVYTFSEKEMDSLSTFFGDKIEQPFILKAIPLDLTKFSTNPNYLKGQAQLIYLENWEYLNGTVDIKTDINEDYNFNIFLSFGKSNKDKKQEYTNNIIRFKTPPFNLHHDDEKISHNGIISLIPDRSLRYGRRVEEKDILFFNQNLYIEDGEINNLNIARNEMISLSWEFLTNYYITLYKCLEYYQFKGPLSLFDNIFSLHSEMNNNCLKLEKKLESNLLNLSYFSNESIRFHLSAIYNNSHYLYNYDVYSSFFLKILVYKNKKLSINEDGTLNISDEEPFWHENFYLFPPLFFLEFNFKGSIFHQGSLNINHEFSKWLLLNAKKIKLKYPVIFQEIRKEIIDCTLYYYDINIVYKLNEIIKRLKLLEPSWFIDFKNLALSENDI